MNRELSSYFEEPEFKEILNKYKGMVESHTPTYFEADELADLADYFIHIGDEEESDKVIDYSLKLHPNNIDALIFKIRSLCYKKEKEKAYQLLDLIDDSTDREVMFLKAELLIDEGRLKDADQIYQTLAENEDESLDVLCDIAACYMDTNNKQYALKWLLYLKDKGYKWEDNQKYRDLLCDFHITLGNPQDAEEIFKFTLDKHPYSIKHWNGLTRCYLLQNDTLHAHEAVDFSLAIDEHDQEAIELKVYCYTKEENYSMAIDMLKKLLPVEDINRERIYALLAQCHTLSNNNEEALKYYKLWLLNGKLTDYEKAELYALIAMCYCNMDKPQEGMPYIDMTLDIDSLNYGAIIQKATIHMQMEENDIAEQLIQRAQSICPDDEKEELLLAIANSHFFLKRYQDVIKWCKIAMEEYPSCKGKASVLIGYSYHEMSNEIMALAYILEALNQYKDQIEQDPKTKEMLDALILDMKEKNKNFNLEDYL